MAILHPLDAFLQERYVSIEFVTGLRDAWRDVVEHVSCCLSAFNRNPPFGLRARPLPEQPDVVWGGRVLPNFLRTLDNLSEAVVLLKNGDPKAYAKLIAGGGVMNDIRGADEFWDGWMTDDDQVLYKKLKSKASAFAFRVDATRDGRWSEGTLTFSYEQNSDPFKLPSKIPLYELDHSVVFKSDEKLPFRGFYLPDVDHGAIAFLHERSSKPYTARRATKLRQFRSTGDSHDTFYWKEHEWAATTWTLVRRVEGKFIDVPTEGFFPTESPEELARWAEQTEQEKVHLVRAGNPCPKAGKWHALAPGSMRRFNLGDIMPELNLPGFANTYWYFESE